MWIYPDIFFALGKRIACTPNTLLPWVILLVHISQMMRHVPQAFEALRRGSRRASPPQP